MDFDSIIRWFESSRPNHLVERWESGVGRKPQMEERAFRACFPDSNSGCPGPMRSGPRQPGQRGGLTQRLLGHLPRNVRTDWAQVASELVSPRFLLVQQRRHVEGDCCRRIARLDPVNTCCHRAEQSIREARALRLERTHGERDLTACLGPHWDPVHEPVAIVPAYTQLIPETDEPDPRVRAEIRCGDLRR